MSDKDEKINHPLHYGGDKPYEAIKVIEAWELGFCLGNTVKYICRNGKKGSPLEDLKKARWYLDREISRLEGDQPEKENKRPRPEPTSIPGPGICRGCGTNHQGPKCP